MAEVVGLVASAITITAVASGAVKFARYLHTLSKHSGLAENDMEAAAKQIETSARAIKVSYLTLKATGETEQSLRSVNYYHQYIERNVSIERRCISRKRRMLESDLEAIRFGFKFMGVIRWRHLKPRVHDLTHDLNTLKLTLILLYLSMQLEMRLSEPRPGVDIEDDR